MTLSVSTQNTQVSFDDNAPATEAIRCSQVFGNENERVIFITGEAGSGKTELLKTICSSYEQKGINYIVVAPTGVAAINCEGQTIHSGLRIPIGINPKYPLDLSYLSEKFDKKIISLLEKIDVIIIDEISMVSAHLLDMISKRLCQVKGTSSVKKPFGGIKTILIGDLLQLPPVIGEQEEKIYYSYYPSPWFFAAKAMKDIPLKTILLSKNYRQENDPAFQKILQCVRSQKNLGQIVDFMNKKCISSEIPTQSSTGKFQTIISSTNKLCDYYNEKELDSIQTECKNLKARIIGNFPEKMMPVKETIQLKVGCRVMIARNIYVPGEGLIASNGDICLVEEINDNEGILVLRKERDDTVFECGRVVWENFEFGVDINGKVKKNSIGEFHQFPIKLGYSVTIHKSQGITLDQCYIDIEYAFAAGLFYVALTRCRTFKGIKLRRRVKIEDLRMDEGILKIYQQIERNNSLFLPTTKQEALV